MDHGAHFHRCDFQVHSPRDTNWAGDRPSNEEERAEYANQFIAACRERGLDVVAITDHHDFAFFHYIKQAALSEQDENGHELPESRRITVFPGMELTLGVPCQALLILDSTFPTEFLSSIYAILSIQSNDPTEHIHAPVKCLEHFTDLVELHKRLDDNESLRGRYIVLPNVTDGGNSSMLRSKFKAHYNRMPCVGGYLDGPYSKLGNGTLKILNGLDREYGNKAIGVFPTSDNRQLDFGELGKHTAWVKWAEPTAEALRQACLARHTRILHQPPELPAVIITSLEVSNSKFLGPLVLEFNPQYNCLIGGRGTGKSTILEYLRWALCDQPPRYSEDDDEVPDFQAKRNSLILNTLVPVQAVVTVGFSINGVPHLVQRDSQKSTVSLKIADSEFRECTEQEVRDLLSIRAYSQKQLSAVGVRTDELVRFIEAPIKRQLADIDGTLDDLKAQIRGHYQTVQRKRALERDTSRDDIEAQSLQQQIDTLRNSLKGLTDADRETLTQHDLVSTEEQVIQAWGRELERLENSVRQVAQEISTMPRLLSPAARLHHKDMLEQIEAQVQAIVKVAKGHVDAATNVLAASSPAMGQLAELRRQWTAKRDAQNTLYEGVKQRASSHETQLNQITTAEERLKTVRGLVSQNKERLAAFGNREESYQKAKREWVKIYKDRGCIPVLRW